MRKNYAGVGYTYDEQRDAFIPPQPFASWTMSEETCLWSAPTPMPTDGKLYNWDEPTLTWIEFVTPAVSEVIIDAPAETSVGTATTSTS